MWFVPWLLCSPNLCSPVHLFPGTYVPRFTANLLDIIVIGIQSELFVKQFRFVNGTVVPALGDPRRERPPTVSGHVINVPTHMSYIQGDIYYNESYKVGSEIECLGSSLQPLHEGRRDKPVISITALADKYITFLPLLNETC